MIAYRADRVLVQAQGLQRVDGRCVIRQPSKSVPPRPKRGRAYSGVVRSIGTVAHYCPVRGILERNTVLTDLRNS